MFTLKAKASFSYLKKAFTTALILRHFDLVLKVMVKTDASGFAITGILSQLFGTGADSRWHLVAFYSKKLSNIESRYNTYNIELIAIVMAFRTWRHYLSYTRRLVVVKTDYNNLKYFITKNKLNNRQIR